MSNRRCPVCNSESLKAAEPVAWVVARSVQCLLTTTRCQDRACGHRWLDASPEFDLAYPAEYYTRHPPGNGVTSRLRVRYGILSSFLSALQKRSRILDVGSGNGATLANVCGKGFSAVGFDVDPVAAAVASQESGVDVRVANSLAEAGFEEGSFDAVIANHVIEHVRTPLTDLSTCLRVVRSGGHALVAVPNAGCFQARVFGPLWTAHEAPRHQQLFSPVSFARLLDEVGADFEVHCRVFQSPRSLLTNCERVWYLSRSRATAVLRIVVGVAGYLLAYPASLLPSGRRFFATNLVAFVRVPSGGGLVRLDDSKSAGR